MNKYITILSLILICGCLGDTASVDGHPVNIIKDKNGNPIVIQYIDETTGKTLYSKNVNSDPSIEKKIIYTSQIPYTYIVFAILIIIIYLVLRIWKLGKDEGDEKDENENNNKHTASTDSSRSGKRRK
jgi:hypothetical protein